MAMKSVLVVVVVVVLWLEVLVLGTFSCPDLCECKWEQGLHTADCTEKNITKVPDNVNKTMQAINLDRNNLTQLAEFEFYDANWVQVRKIRMQFCHLKSLNKNLFSGLPKLQHLDLSHNHLSVINNNSFPAFPDLETLDMSDNILTNIHRASFLRIGRNLVSIDLSGNRLILIPWTIFQYLPMLRLINLERNPWYCNCNLGKLYSELTQRNILTGNPSCFSTQNKSAKSWSSLSMTEFSCAPTVSFFSPQDKSEVAPGKNVTMECQVKGNPLPEILWMKDKKIILEGNKRHGVNITQMDNDRGSEVTISVLTIMNISESTLGLYSCIATNIIGSDEKHNNLTFYRSSQKVESAANHLYIIIVISLSSTTLLIIICIRKFWHLNSNKKEQSPRGSFLIGASSNSYWLSTQYSFCNSESCEEAIQMNIFNGDVSDYEYIYSDVNSMQSK